MGGNIQEYIQTEHSGVKFENICGREFWKRVLGSYVADETSDQVLEMETSQGILLYGPFGSGKTTLLAAQAGEMISAGYQYLEVDLTKIPEDRMPELCEVILEYCEKGPCYLYLDHIEVISDGALLWKLYAQATRNENHLMMTAAAEDVCRLNPIIRKLFHVHYVGLPDASERQNYLNTMLQRNFKHESLQCMKLLVDGTDGYNYLELNALINQIKLQIKYRILSHEISEKQAMNILSIDIVEEVLAMKKPEEKQNESIGISNENMAALMQMFTSVQAPPAPETEKKDEKIEKAPEDLLEDLDPEAVFNQGLYF